MTEQRIIAVVREKLVAFTPDYDGLIGVLRVRVEALNCPHLPLEEYLGLSPGHLGKILSPAEDKRIGLFKLWEMLEKLGLVMAIHEHLDIASTIDEMGRKYRTRAGWAKTGRLRKRMAPALLTAAAQHYGAMGKGIRKTFRISSRAVSAQRRKAARSRWHKPKITEVIRIPGTSPAGVPASQARVLRPPRSVGTAAPIARARPR